jgi:hypothetical protein
MAVMRCFIAGVVVPLLIAGCASGGRPSEPLDDGAVLPSSDKDLGASARPSLMVEGRLGFDAVEGGCAYLERDDGTRYEVIYPDGWRVDLAGAALLGPNGERIPAGGLVTVRGSIATDRSSICQLGPIFEATEVIPGG